MLFRSPGGEGEEVRGSRACLRELQLLRDGRSGEGRRREVRGGEVVGHITVVVVALAPSKRAEEGEGERRSHHTRVFFDFAL